VDEDVAFLSATEIATAVRERQLSPLEVVDRYLGRIERLNPRLNAYITVTAEHARTAARELEKKLSRRKATGPLLGVPVAVKDQFCTQGVRTTDGSFAYRDFIPRHDATVVQRLTDAGAIMLGKLAMSELALGGTRRSAWGTTRNPWDTERTPGESSTGSGAALGAHLCAASVGEDTGGSGRVPAAYCNAVGLRPTYGRVSRNGMMTACWFLDQAAPMTKTVADCALLLGVIAGRDELDMTTSRRRVPDYAASLGDGIQGVRIGVIRELHEHPNVHPDVKACVDRALQRFTELGAHVREVSIPLMNIAGALYIAIGDTEGAGAADDLLREHSSELDAASRTRLLAAALVPFKLYNRAMKARVQLRRQFINALECVDVLACATSPYPPPRHADLTAPFQDGDDVRSRFFFRRAYTGSYALAALPAISVPCGFTSRRLPVGLQLGGKPFAEEMLLRVAAAYERAEPWHLQRAPEATIA